MITVLESCLSDPFTVYFATQYTWIAYSCIVSGIIGIKVLGASFHKCLSERSKLRYGMCRCETMNVVYITSFGGRLLEYDEGGGR